MKLYNVRYWDGPTAENENGFRNFECLVDSKTIDSLTAEKVPKFIKVIINDGEEMIIQSENINQMKQVYKTALDRF